MRKPIKRHKSLQPVSRDHHQGLLLCWKIRQGLNNGTSLTVIKDYVNWFYMEHLLPHFNLEEQTIFPILDSENKLVIRALNEHTKIKELIVNDQISADSLKELANTIEQHIRFEERILFNEIQIIASEEQLNSLGLIESEQQFCENSEFDFWN